jgi:uncharacterized protein
LLKFICVIAISLLTAAAAGAASFDCEKAAGADEKVICADRGLNDADVKMTTMFDIEVDLVAMGERDTLRSTQKAWLEKRAGCKADAACLRTAYDQRLKDLQKVLADIVARGPH